MIKVKDLIAILLEKDQEQSLQYVITSTSGEIIAMQLDDKYVDVMKFLKFLKAFKKPKQSKGV